MSKKGPRIGILMLDCSPFNIPGCAACDETYPFLVERLVVPGATVEKMTSGSEALLEPIMDTARELERSGVDAIIGDCGFMALYQEPLQEKASVPVFTSSLLLVPMVANLIPKKKRIGILTFRADTLGETIFKSAGWSSHEIPVLVASVEDQSAWQLLRTPEHPFHGADLEQQLLDVCRRLGRDHPDLGALVLECTVMPPFAYKIQTEIDVPIFDITMIASLLATSFSRNPFGRQDAQKG